MRQLFILNKVQTDTRSFEISSFGVEKPSLLYTDWEDVKPWSRKSRRFTATVDRPVRLIPYNIPLNCLLRQGQRQQWGTRELPYSNPGPPREIWLKAKSSRRLWRSSKCVYWCKKRFNSSGKTKIKVISNTAQCTSTACWGLRRASDSSCSSASPVVHFLQTK